MKQLIADVLDDLFLHDYKALGPAWMAREAVIDVLLWMLVHVETCKNRGLAHRLHNIADQYDPRPTGAWR